MAGATKGIPKSSRAVRAWLSLNPKLVLGRSTVVGPSKKTSTDTACAGAARPTRIIRVSRERKSRLRCGDAEDPDIGASSQRSRPRPDSPTESEAQRSQGSASYAERRGNPAPHVAWGRLRIGFARSPQGASALGARREPWSGRSAGGRWRQAGCGLGAAPPRPLEARAQEIVVRDERDGALQRGHGAPGLPEAKPERAEVDQSLRVVGVELEGTLVGGDRPLVLAAALGQRADREPDRGGRAHVEAALVGVQGQARVARVRRGAPEAQVVGRAVGAQGLDPRERAPGRVGVARAQGRLEVEL